MEEKIT